jgi:hypothetical protein
MLLILVSLMLSGCQSEEGIVTYAIPTKIPEQLLPGKDRLLAVMIPRGEKVWFFKIVGPQDAVASVADSFRDYVTAIEFDESDEPILGSLPEGWQLGGKKPMRFATIDINTPKKQLDLSVSELSVPGEMDQEKWDAYVVQNVDRWRGQIGLRPSDEKWSGGEPIRVASAEERAVWIDLVGQPGAKGSGGPMMPTVGGPTGRLAMRGSGDRDETGGADPPIGQASASELKFETPEGWQMVKVRAGGIREAAFTIGSEEAAAEVTVVTAGGDLRSNVARWMGQVSGGSPEDSAVDEMLAGAEEIQVSGRPAQRFVIAGDDQKGQKSIDATIVPMGGGSSKFIKMMGAPQTVARQSDSLRTFLESLSF